MSAPGRDGKVRRARVGARAAPRARVEHPVRRRGRRGPVVQAGKAREAGSAAVETTRCHSRRGGDAGADRGYDPRAADGRHRGHR